MEIKELKSKLTLDHVVTLLEEMGAEPRQSSNLNEIWCKTICHDGNSHKLYLYKESLNFHCYTHCGSMDIFQLVQNHKDINLIQAMDYICNRFGFSNNSFKFGFDNRVHTSDLELANSFSKKSEVKREEWKPFKTISDKVLVQFYDFYHPSFYNDGISPLAMSKFEIKFDILNNRIIIPHRYIDGKLIAVRSRNLEQELIDRGMKYIPIIDNGKQLSAPTGQYFYGLFQNYNNIILAKKVILVESEKGVMQYETMYPNANITLALSSSNLSAIQIDILKTLGVEEIILALDKEYEVSGSEEEQLYSRKIEKVLVNRLNFCTVSVMWDVKGLLKKKESPLDAGRTVFDELLRNRIYIKD